MLEGRISTFLDPRERLLVYRVSGRVISVSLKKSGRKVVF